MADRMRAEMKQETRSFLPVYAILSGVGSDPIRECNARRLPRPLISRVLEGHSSLDLARLDRPCSYASCGSSVPVHTWRAPWLPCPSLRWTDIRYLPICTYAYMYVYTYVQASSMSSLSVSVWLFDPSSALLDRRTSLRNPRRTTVTPATLRRRCKVRPYQPRRAFCRAFSCSGASRLSVTPEHGARQARRPLP